MDARKGNRGFGLLELLVATSVLAMIAVAGLAGTVRVFRVGSDEMVRANQRGQVTACWRRVRADLGAGRVLGVDPAGDAIVYQVPVDPDGDGDPVNGSGQVDWGAEEGGLDVAGATVTLHFRVVRTIAEAAVDQDLNGDGDRDDTFDVGHLRRVTSGGQAAEWSGNWILQPSGNHGGDLDGDGRADPLFRVADRGRSRSVTLDLLALSPVPGSAFRVRRAQLTTLLVNEAP